MSLRATVPEQCLYVFLTLPEKMSGRRERQTDGDRDRETERQTDRDRKHEDHRGITVTPAVIYITILMQQQEQQ